MKFRNFEIRPSSRVRIPVSEDHNEFDLVRWMDDNSYCLPIATIKYRQYRDDFSLNSIGLRYLEWREDGLEEFILNWCNLQRIIIERGEK